VAFGALSINIAANALGKIWIGALQFAFLPIYLALLGPTQYGLMGFYATLSVSLTFLDHAITPVIVREMARHQGAGGSREDIRDLLHSLSVIAFALGTVIGIVLALAAPVIARHWLHPNGLDERVVVDALRLMGLAIACQWPSNLYLGGFIGMHRQTTSTIIRVITASAQWGGGAIVLGYSADIRLAIGWHALSFAVLTLVLGRALWQFVPQALHRPRFQPAALRKVARYALGTLTIGLTGTALTQMDKLLAARFVPLEDFAAYTLAFSAATVIAIAVASPITATLSAYFAALFVKDDKTVVAVEYHRWSQLVAVAVLPGCSALIFYAPPLVHLWLGSDSALSGRVAALLPVLSAGTALNALASIPLALQVASGWTRVMARHNAVSALIAAVVLTYGLGRWGVEVGAWYWLALNLGYVCVMVPTMHRRLLQQELAAWISRDVLVPTMACFAIFGASVAIPIQAENVVQRSLQAAATAAIATAFLAILLPGARRTLVGLVRF
jgi:O-antigen/teichoic acid export membrane protein